LSLGHRYFILFRIIHAPGLAFYERIFEFADMWPGVFIEIKDNE
jgi:hypothetical protein